MQTSNDYLLKKISQTIPELDICIPSPEAGWLWTYRCLEQESDACATVADALLDFLKVQLEAIDKAVADVNVEDSE